MKTKLQSKRSTVAIGDAFEKRVQALYDILGYDTEHDVIVSGQQVDIVATMPVPGAPPLRLLLECKAGIDVTVGIETVNDVSGTLSRIRDQGLVSAVIVTEGRFSRQAKSAATDAEIRLLTFDELYEEAIGLRLYAANFLAVLAGEKTLAKVNVSLSWEIGRFIGEQPSHVPLWCLDEGHRRLQLNKWMFHCATSCEPISACVVGEFGTGKTFSMMEACRGILHKVVVGSLETRVPVFIPLRTYRGRLDTKQIVSDIARIIDPSGRRHRQIIHSVLNEGRLLLIFDGLDEVVIDRSLEEARGAVYALTSGEFGTCPIIVTTRSELFTSSSDLDAVFPASLSNIPFPILWRQKRVFKRLRVLPWSENQVRQYVTWRLKGRGLPPDALLRYGTIRDLLRRPLLASLAVILAKEGRWSDEVVTTKASFIKMALELWSEGERWRSILDFDTRIKFLEVVACEMLRKKSLMLPRNRVESLLLDLCPTIGEGRLLADEASSCGVLDWYEGRATFQHKALMDYLIAKCAVQEISEWSEVPKNVKGCVLEVQKLNREIIELALEIGLNETHLWKVLDWSRGKTVEQCGYIGGNAATLLREKRSGQLSGSDFRSTVLIDATFRGAELSQTDFRDAKLAHSGFDGCDLTEADFRGADLQYASLKSSGALYCIAAYDNKQGKHIIVGGTSGRLLILDSGSGSIEFDIDAHGDYLLSCTADSSAGIIATGGRDHRIRLWSPGEGVSELGGHFDGIRGLAFLHSRALISIGDDGRIVCWSIDERREIWARRLADGPLWCLAVNKRNYEILVGSSDGRVWLSNEDGKTDLVCTCDSDASAVAFSNKGFVIGDGDGRIIIIDKKGKLNVIIKRPSVAVRSIAVIPTTGMVVSLWSDGKAMGHLDSLKGGGWDNNVHKGIAHAVTFLSGKAAASVGYDGKVVCMDVTNGNVIWEQVVGSAKQPLRCAGMKLHRATGLCSDKLLELKQMGAVKE